MTDIGAYCREVEAHLTKVNGGHLVRIVGPGFSLVRGWAESGVPLSVVFRGIDQKAERHRAGASRRPLRIEFCEADVSDVFETWRRAVGVTTITDAADAETGIAEAAVDNPDRGSGPTRRSVSRDLDRAAERLVRLAGRLDLPDALRDAVTGALAAVTETRDAIRTLRGPQRQERLAGLVEVDQQLVDAACAALPAGEAATIRAEAEASLDAYRSRLSADAWTRAVRVNLTRLVRDHYQLPTLADGEMRNEK